MSQPNILLIMTDQQRYDSLGVTGFTGGHTPNLDGLANSGTLFTHCYTTNPICTPARASLMTGKHLPGHGVYRLYDCLPESEVLFTERLKTAGYQTALFGKLHVSSRFTEEKQRHPHDGFDIYEWCIEPSIALDAPDNGYGRWLKAQDEAFYERLKQDGRKVLHVPRHLHMTHWAAERTIDYLRTRDAETPFFCMMSVFDPHDPYEDYPDEMDTLIQPPDFPALVPGPENHASEPEAHQRERREGYMDDFASYSADEIAKIRRGYHASIALIDLEVGRVLAALEEQGLAENTLVIFVSDHGDMLGDHDLLIKGAYFFDPCVRVPLIMRWPATIPAGQRSEALVQLHDLAATILDAAGASSVDLAAWTPDSRSLLAAAADTSNAVRDHAVVLYRNSGRGLRLDWEPPMHATMYRNARYKLTLYHGDTVGELYDMQTDPNEQRNLWNCPDYAQIQSQLIAQAIDWLAEQETRYLGSRGGTQMRAL